MSEVQDATEFLPCRELSCKRNLESEVSNFLIYCARRNSSQKSGPRGPLDFYHSIEEDDQHAIQQNANNEIAHKIKTAKKWTTYIESIAEHSDSMMEDGIATAAW